MVTLNSDQAQSIPDLAASLTDQALELLGRVGARGDSVEMELKLWRSLTVELKQELREHHELPRPSNARLNGALKQVVRRAIADQTGFSEYRTLGAERCTGHLCQV